MVVVGVEGGGLLLDTYLVNLTHLAFSRTLPARACVERTALVTQKKTNFFKCIYFNRR